VEMLLDETVAFAKSATGAAQQEGVRLRLELLTLLHRFCRPLLLTWEMTSRLWNGLEVLECRSLLFPWMRASLTHTAAVEPASEHAFACFTPDVRSEVLARLLDLSASLLDVQAYHLFQNVMIGINADAGKLKIGGWCAKESAITGDDYCASSAMPAGHDGVELLEFNVSGTNSITGVIAGAGSTTKELHGSRAVPKGQDGAKLVGTWVKVLQHGQVWKDGQLTRCYSQAGSTATYDIRYVDGCVQRRNLQSLRSWMLIDPLDTQMPMVVNITAVTDGDLLGLDVLWRAAVQSPNEEVSMLARSLLFRLYTQMGDTLCSEETIQLALDTADPGLAETICDSIGVPHSLSCKALVLNQNEWDSTFQWLQERQMDGTLDAEAKTPLTLEQAQRATDALPADLRVRLVDQVEAGLRESIEMLESGNAEIAEQMIRRQIDIVQSFVNRYQTNSKARQHAVSRRGRPLTVKVLYGTIEAHENMTCGDLHTKVCAHLHLVTKTPLEIAKGDQVVGSLPNSSATTLAVAQVENGFEIRERKDKIGERPVVEASVVLDHFCPGELLAQSDKWFELLFDLLDRAISTATRAAIWHLLMSIPTMAFEKNEVSQFRIRWTKTNFLRTVYDLQVVEAIIDPPNEDSGTAAEDWRRSFISNGDHFKEFIKFVTAMESHGANLDDSMVCAHCLPVAMRVLYFCICSALPDSPNVTRGLSRSFSSSSATAVFEALENTLGSDYFSVLVKHVCRLMAKAVAARQAQATIFGAQVLLAVAAQPDATVAVLHVAVPLLVNLLVTCTEDMVRAEAVDVLHCIALVSEEAGLYIMDKVRRSPPNADCCAICEQYFELLQQLQRSLSTTRQDLAASLVTDLQSTYAADFDHHPDGEKPTRCRIDLLRDIFEQDVSIRDTTVTVELIDLLWSRYLMAIARDDEDQTPVCCSAGGRHAVCALLDQSVASTVGSVEESSHFSFLVQLVSEFVSATRAPMQRDGESPEFDYDPEKRTGYGDSTTAKLRNSTNLAGLTNQGNTCYMNSVLQQLYGSREVRRAVLDAPLGLRVQVENYYSASLKSGAEVILQAPGMEPLCVSGEFGLGFNGRSELTQTLPEGRYTVRVSCEGKVSSQEHDLCTGVHLILLSDQEGQIAQTVRSQPIVTEVHRCFSFLEYGASACVDTSSLCNSLHACQSPSGASYLEYPIRSQNDAAEFLGKIVDTLGEDMKGSKAAASLKDLLTSTKVVEKQCLECKTVSHTVEDHAVLLSVTIETPELEKLGSLEQALESAAKPEILSGTNAVDCEKCHKKCPTSRSSLAKKLPRVLLVHLTRFVQNMYGEYHKANHRVTFPQRLDMRPYTTTSADREVSEPPAWYELTGVVLHSGTQRAGHYTSLVKHGGQWITFDDQHASPFEGDLEDVCFGGEEEITQSWGTNRTSKREKSKNAYILMYQLEGESADGSSCDSSADLDVKRKATPKMDSAAEGETPDPATWAARRNLREALQEHKQTLQRQQRLFNPELLGLIRSLCTLGLGEPGLAESEHAPEVEPEPAPEVEPEPAPEVEPEPSPEVEPEPAPEVEPTTDVASGTEPDEEPEQPTGLQSRLLQLGLTTFVHIVCRYRDHSNTAAWSTLLAHWLSQPKHLSSACWLVLRVGGEDGWAEADAVLKPAVPKSYAARNGFVNVLRAAVDLVRVNRGEREDAVEAAAIVAVSVEHPGCVPSESNDETAATASTPSDLETVIDAGMEAELATAIAVKDAHSAPELNHDDQALNTALASVRKQLAKHDVNTATVASGGRRNAVAPGTAPPVPPLMLMDRSADADPLAPIDVKIENNDCKPMQLYGQPSPDREWRFLQNINPGSQFPFEKNQMSTFKGVVPGVAEYTWKRKPTEEGPLTFNKRNYTGESICPCLPNVCAPVRRLLPVNPQRSAAPLTFMRWTHAWAGFSPDNASASAVTAAGHSEPRAHSPPSGVASKDAGSGSDATPMGVGTSHKAEPTPEEEAIISQATAMRGCGRQAVVCPPPPPAFPLLAPSSNF
jgi:ubiquitin C-terminal hydrolase